MVGFLGILFWKGNGKEVGWMLDLVIGLLEGLIVRFQLLWGVRRMKGLGERSW